MTYYEILGVDRLAEPDVIDAAYRAMMRRYHPDTFAGAKEEAERRAKLLNEAYAVLRDAERRHAYDETLGPAHRPVPPVAEALPNPQADDGDGFKWRHALVLIGLGGAAAFALVIGRASDPAPVAVAPRSEAVPPVDVAKAPTAASKAEPATDTADAAPCRGVACRVLTPFGWGGIEAGATTGSAERASGMTIRDDGHYTDVGEGACLAYEVVGGPGNLRMLVEGGVVTTVEAYLELKRPRFRTDRGIGLGDAESAVRKAYKGLKQLPDIYSEPPDKKLFHYEPGGERGIKFSINGGKVTGISVGTRSIEYVEGCL